MGRKLKAGTLGKRRKKQDKWMRLESHRFNEFVRNRLLPAVTEEAVPDAVLAIALEVDAKIMEEWPVDTGRSRAAWSVLLSNHGMPEPSGKTSENESADAKEEGRSMGDAEESLRPSQPFVKLINGVEYAPWIEAGSSPQARRGVVRMVMRDMRKQFAPEVSKRVKKKVKK